jgi:hypothetical protein
MGSGLIANAAIFRPAAIDRAGTNVYIRATSEDFGTKRATGDAWEIALLHKE